MNGGGTGEEGPDRGGPTGAEGRHERERTRRGGHVRRRIE
jgi:hypothetical protein